MAHCRRWRSDAVFPQSPQITLCESCGAGVPKGQHSKHTCDRETMLTYQARLGAFTLDSEIPDYLTSKEAKFFEFLCERER